MTKFSLIKKSILAALLMGMAAQPVFADVKAGVDAWTRGEYDKAVKEWRDPALKGDVDAQFNMGQAYKLGRGVKADLVVAADWYQKAAQKGHLQASDAYGHLMHYRGKVTEALPYLQSSADRGEPRSQYLLATELFNGNIAGKDWVRAYAYMTRASSAGLAPASRSLAQMDQYIPLEQRQQGVAFAGQLEQREGKARSAALGGFDINTKAPTKVARPVDVPPSVPMDDAQGFPGDVPAMDGEEPVERPVAKPVARPAAKPVAKPAAVRTAAAPAAASGNYRIQLGAFSNEGNAKSLWNSLERKVGDLAALTPYLKAAGSVTRLQAGPFSTRASAEAMCGKVKAAGQACLVTTN
jgi:uncharacterized protein